MKIYKILSLLLLFIIIATKVQAQSEDEAIKTTLLNYLDGGGQGDSARLSKAFYPTANLRSFKEGRVSDMPVKKFIATVPQGGAKWASKIVNYSYAGTAATAVTEEELEAFKFIDFLNLLKVNGEWKIVSRVFARVEKGVEVTSSLKSSASPSATTTSKNAVKKPTPKKSDDGWR